MPPAGLLPAPRPHPITGTTFRDIAYTDLGATVITVIGLEVKAGNRLAAFPIPALWTTAS